MEMINMRQLTVEELFDKVDIWYNDEDGTLTLKYDGHLAWEVNGNIINNSNENILFFSNHENNKKIFMNTGTYSYLNDIRHNMSVVEDAYKQSMDELTTSIDQMDKTQIEVCIH